MDLKIYHYYDRESGPFRNLSKLALEEAVAISSRLRQEGTAFASKRSEDYMLVRRELEGLVRSRFIDKGGKPKLSFPHYMTVEACEWLASWYRNPGVIAIDWGEFADESISFTYGDMFPTMRYQDHKPYRKQVYTKKEIVAVIQQFGFPQAWNKLGDHGPERYIEVQVWDEDVIGRYM